MEPSPLEKLLAIEKKFETQSAFIDRGIEGTRDFSPGSPAFQHALESNDLLYSWPLLKRKRALTAALIVTAGFIGLILLVAGVLLCIGGVQGLVKAIAAVEIVFFVFHKFRYWRLNAQPDQYEPDGHDGWLHFCRFIRIVEASDKSMLDINSYISVWFRGAPIESIKSENVMDLLTYGFYYKRREQLEAEGQGDVAQKMLDELERVYNFKFEKGFNPNARFLEHLREPLRSVYRPLLFYTLTEFSEVLAHSILIYMGFVKLRFGGYSCFTFAGDRMLANRMSQSRTIFKGGPRRRLSVMGNALPEPSPIVFLHGVGLGILPYLDFVCSLVCTGHPVIVVEYRHVAMRLSWRIPKCSQVGDTVVSILREIGLDRATFVAHSYGTFALSRILKTNPDMVQSASFIDPVCIGMFLPKLLDTFVYKRASWESMVQFARDFLRISVSRELGITASMCRGFEWSELNLWPEDMKGTPTLVVFSGHDTLVPSPEAKHFLGLLAPDTRVLYHPGLSHGEFLGLPDWKLEIIGEVLTLAYADCKMSSEEADAERVARKTSLAVSVEEMVHMRSRIMNKIGQGLEKGVAKTLSLPWKQWDDALGDVKTEDKARILQDLLR
ncbi:unnamed protein product [Ostreobium quekettii]|uniref:AB hydrolase-1 domain-containing protein n=1 Tax=Ostreobium quekettii TaxID=121088 RepID=A0A8S1ITA7_9CHLO|nr:unnamed protein product [Ostreobium quekettii]|eukprot:evm.model.scf_504EXC.6 EVM.evm.TU.scf_504EXC.6   scf_504EXC:47538-52153(+)